ncbi:MAG TPA: ankyrin repeat domain-containing protein [Ktedonobacterales bacterium]
MSQHAMVADDNVFARLAREQTGFSLGEWVRVGELEIVKDLLQAGGSPALPGEDEETALMVVCKGGQADLVILLLVADASVDAVNDYGATALMFAASKGNDRLIRHLLAAGVDVHYRDADHDTALVWTASWAFVHYAPAARGRRFHASNQIGETARALAVVYLHKEVEALLDEVGARIGPNVMAACWGRRHDLQTALHAGDVDRVYVLIEYGKVALEPPVL